MLTLVPVAGMRPVLVTDQQGLGHAAFDGIVPCLEGAAAGAHCKRGGEYNRRCSAGMALGEKLGVASTDGLEEEEEL